MGAAHAALEARDYARAHREVCAALIIDPDFLAARSLREQIVAASSQAAAPPASTDSAGSAQAGAGGAKPRPLVSAEGWARFENRARQRRIERKLAATREALKRRRFGEARAALNEARELAPEQPEILGLSAELDAAERERPRAGRRGPWLAAAAAFASIVLGATLLENGNFLHSYPIVEIAELISEPVPPSLPAVAAPAPEVIAATLVNSTAGELDARDRPSFRAETPPLDTPVAELVSLDQPLSPIALLNAPVALEPTPAPLVLATLSPPPPPMVTTAPSIPQVDDDQLVRRTLTRYRSAYDDLDADSAQAVWPTVSQTALARAFDGLQSQRLTFDRCDVRLNGGAATATCVGSARYVPKIGSREPRIEPRVWSFSLRKTGTDWTIETARAR